MVSTNLSIFCSCAAEIGRASSAAAQVAAIAQLPAIDIATMAATSNLFIRALMQLYFCKLYSAARTASTPIRPTVSEGSSLGGAEFSVTYDFTSLRPVTASRFWK